jgi:hypothetical protein
MSLSPPNPLFQWGPQSKEILLNLGINSAFYNAQGSRVIIVAVQVGRSSENICHSSGHVQEKGKKQDETQFTTQKNDVFMSCPRILCLWQGFFKNSLSFGPNSGFWCWVFLTLPISLKAATVEEIH